MSVTGGIMAGIGAAGSLGSSLIGSSAASSAAAEQVAMEQQALQLQEQNQTNAVNFEKGVWSGTQSNLQPFLTAGNQGLGTLESLLGLSGNPNATGYGSLAQGFTAPTAEQAAAMPGYQFQQQQMQEALQNQAAAKGNLISGNTAEAEANYANQLAGTNYQQTYNNAFNTFETNQANQYNRLLGLSNMGLGAGTALGQLGNQAGSTIGNIYTNASAQQGQTLGNIGAAQASGTIGSANAWMNGLGGATNNLSNLFLLSQLNGMLGGGGSSYSSPAYGGLTPDQISAAYGGPASAPTTTSDVANQIPLPS